MRLFRIFGASPSPNPDSSEHALGPKVLTTVANARVDIIFLHGLTGHREKTWTALNEKEPWPKTLLSQDLPTARIITYGYDADVTHFTSPANQNTIREHAKNLINDLAALRLDAVGRPIIFVVHSLGGLVCQDALLVCNDSNEEAQRDILSSTHGIAFLGTPHAGADVEKFKTAVANIIRLFKKPNKRILKVLNTRSETLANIKNGFFTIVQRRGDRQSNLKPIELHAFVEEHSMDFLGCPVVDSSSAQIPGHGSDTIPDNHIQMTKFRTASDIGYQSVLNRLKLWIDDDVDSIASRYPNGLTTELAKLKIKLANSEPDDSVKQVCESSDIRKSLKWFLDSSEYQAWKQGSSLKLWLHGERGDGKTVVVFYILNNLYQDTLHTSRQNLASIFCSSNDSEASIVAALAFQLLQNNIRASAIQKEFPISKIQQCDGDHNLTSYLWELLKGSIKAAAGLDTVLIDGLDKLDDDEVISSFLSRLNNLEKEVNLRVLISSENIEDIQRILVHYPSIDREKERRECLKTLEFQQWNAREIDIEDVDEAGKNLFLHTEYKQWREDVGPSLLWIEGKPGSGKSTLTKFMVRKLGDELRKQARQNDSSPIGLEIGGKEWTFSNPNDKNVIIARFYYSFRGRITQTSHELMLRSIIYQIWKENSRLFPLIQDHYRKLKIAGRGTREQKSLWGYNDLVSVLQSLRDVDFGLRVFILIDGMDESEKNKRADVLNFLTDLAIPEIRCVIKLFIASRPENDINCRLRDATHHIKLQEIKEDDISLVVEEWMKRMISQRNCNEETLSEVKGYIMKHSIGVFLWVALVLREMEQCIADGGFSKRDLHNRLRSLPKDLGGRDGFYQAMVRSLVKKYKEDTEKRERGRRILTWITFAERPVSITELQDILASPPMSESRDLLGYDLIENRPHQLDQGIVSFCGGLVEVGKSGSKQILQLIHQTAREFLLRKDKVATPYYLEEAGGDMETVMTCCQYIVIVFCADILRMEGPELFKVKIVTEYLSEQSLLVYALMNFQTHLDRLQSNYTEVHAIFQNIVEHLMKWSTSYAAFLLSQWVGALKWAPELHIEDKLARLYLHSLLMFAGDSQNTEAIQILLALRKDLLHLEARWPHPAEMELHQSIETGRYQQADGVELLLGNGANIEAQDEDGRTPLSHAAENGHKASMDVLLNNGADIEAKDKDMRTPLSYAAKNGHKASICLLLDRGANIEAKDKDIRAPLSYAAENGHDASIYLLLDRGADIQARDKDGITPLSYAIKSKHGWSVYHLLEWGADVEAKDNYDRTPLLYAAKRGYDIGIDLLLDRGANVEAKDKDDRTPLSYAIESGNEASMKLLHDIGA